jgi:hypothetical protein
VRIREAIAAEAASTPEFPELRHPRGNPAPSRRETGTLAVAGTLVRPRSDLSPA